MAKSKSTKKKRVPMPEQMTLEEVKKIGYKYLEQRHIKAFCEQSKEKVDYTAPDGKEYKGISAKEWFIRFVIDNPLDCYNNRGELTSTAYNHLAVKKAFCALFAPDMIPIKKVKAKSAYEEALEALKALEASK